MKILVTGVAGFLGSHVADALLDRGYTVIGIDNMTGGDKENINAKCEFYEIDCQDINCVNKIMTNVDIVFHVACTAYDGLAICSPSRLHHILNP
jgi:UDP-glucose 4-epimerase